MNENKKTFYEPQIFCDHFQNFKSYGIPKAQLIIADVPYCIGKNAYASNPTWYEGGDNRNGESKLAGKAFFESDLNFSPEHFMIFCSRLQAGERRWRQTGKKQCIRASAVPSVRADARLHQDRGIARTEALHSAGVPEEIFRASAQSEHEDSREL